MEYLALFIWLALCLLVGALVHYLMSGALSHRAVQLLAAPGMIVRKVTMTVVALLCGGTVTRVSIYQLAPQDVDFRADGIASVAKVLVPLAPLFGGALAMMKLNVLFGSPLNLSYTHPSLAALNVSGFRGFFYGTWLILSSIVGQAIRADWQTLRLYVMFALIFSLALGACSAFPRVKEALLGAVLVTVALALFSSIAVRRAGVLAASPEWFTAARSFIVNCAGVAFLMTVYGVLIALPVGLCVRFFETMSKGGAKGSSRKRGRAKGASADDEDDRLAA